MKTITSFVLVFSFLFLSTGCASVCNRNEKVARVLKTQSEVLKKIIELREKEDFKNRLHVDPVLLEQESVLMAGMTAVVKSEETMTDLKCKSKKCGGANARE